MSFEQSQIELIPEKFRKAPRIQDFVAGCGYINDILMSKIDGLTTLIDALKVDDEFINFLLENDGADISTLTIDSLTQRDLLLNLLSWYKVKGTDNAFKILFYSKGFRVEVVSLWTVDYATFYDPTYDTIPAGAYITPHFVLRVDLLTLFGGDILPPLGFQTISALLPSITPINNVLDGVYFSGAITVPYYLPGTTLPNAFGIQTDLFMANTYVSSTDTGLYTDDGRYTDSNIDYSLIFNQFQYGSGHKTSLPSTSETALENYEGTGYIEKITRYSDYTEVICRVPSSAVVENGISEIGIFDVYNDMMVIASFPNIYKEAGYEIEFIMKVYDSAYPPLP